ncbi:MAG: SGNH/GDSL hydrolase family protein [Candidatus Delongbacteria bacterium]
MMRYIIYFLILRITVVFSADSVYVHLPDSVYTTTDSELSIFYTNLIRDRFENKEQISFNCSVGYPDSMKYNLDSLSTGIYDLTIQIRDSNGVYLEEAGTKIVVTENSTVHLDTLKILMIGDSFTYSGVYPKYIKDLYESSTNYPVKLLGTNYNSGSPFYGIDNDIFHEGYSGKSWFWFVAYEESPFVYDGQVDFQKYIDDFLYGEIPDIVTIFLGINDIGSGDPSSIETIDERIEIIFERMMLLINPLTETLPDASIGIVLTPPTNEREETYTNPDLPDYWERKLMHHRLSQRYVDHFNDLGNANISVIPANVSIDTYNGYGSSDSIHPNIYGYNQIGNSIYSWIKCRISKWLTVPKGLELVNEGNYTTITWNPSTGATSYRIYRSVDPYSGFVEIGTSSVPEFTDNDISGSDKYFYKVTAVDGTE